MTTNNKKQETRMTKPHTMPEAAACIDQMAELIDLSEQTIIALTVENKSLRRKNAQLEGDKAELHARLAAGSSR